MGLAAELLLQKLRKKLCVLDLEGQQHMLRCKTAAEIVLLHQTGNRGFLFIRHREDFVVLVQQIAAAEMEHRKTGLGFRLTIADHVRIGQGSRRDKLLLPQCFHSIQAVTKIGCQFKFQIFRSGQHLLFDLICHGFIVSCQKLSGLLDPLPILGAGLMLLTPPFALVHVVVQAGPVLADIPGKFPFTAGELQCQSNGFHHVLGHTAAAIRAVIARSVV